MNSVFFTFMHIYILYKTKTEIQTGSGGAPALKNGNVTPITGRRLKHMPRLITDWNAIIAKNPKHI